MGERAQDLAGYFARITEADSVSTEAGRTAIHTPRGTIVLALPEAFESAFGVPPPHPGDGPHLAGFTIACRTLDVVEKLGLARVGTRRVAAPAAAFGTAIGFVEGSRA